MIPAHLLTETLTWMEPGETTDRYGNTVDDFTPPDDGWPTITGWVEQRDTSEQRDGRDTVVSTWLLVTNELAATAKARFGWDGKTYEVDGQPEVFRTPAGPHHAEMRLLLVEG